MTQAFVAAIIIGLLLSYLGVHVVRRGIVFVDLALGQISSLGVAIAAYLGTESAWIPIAATLIGAFLLSLIKIEDNRLKQEAIIGIIYAIASAATVLLISKSAHGDSDIQEVLFGNILAVSWSQITTLAIVFGGLGLLHFIFRKKFFALTERFENNQGDEVGVFNFWNFIFYISIGLAIVFAVEIGGVIPIFAYLIIPGVCGIMISKSKSVVILSAIGLSILGGFFGLNMSFNYDFPAGSSIVAMLGILFALVSIYNLLSSSQKMEEGSVQTT
ncbi:metal ABC transporter permease [Fodinibius sp. SL11]|uniref:metal ABC transporter permease n=1 Tax=Fodinibius sp. SL11 TaxID=3425690 RepID=UPI003F881FC0